MSTLIIALLASLIDARSVPGILALRICQFNPLNFLGSRLGDMISVVFILWCWWELALLTLHMGRLRSLCWIIFSCCWIFLHTLALWYLVILCTTSMCTWGAYNRCVLGYVADYMRVCHVCHHLGFHRTVWAIWDAILTPLSVTCQFCCCAVSAQHHCNHFVAIKRCQKKSIYIYIYIFIYIYIVVCVSDYKRSLPGESAFKD